jgi:hypothetical protein
MNRRQRKKHAKRHGLSFTYRVTGSVFVWLVTIFYPSGNRMYRSIGWNPRFSTSPFPVELQGMDFPSRSETIRCNLETSAHRNLRD